MLLQVLRLGKLSQINERCLDLQRSRASSSRKAAAAAAASTSAAASDSKGGVVGLMQQPAKQRSRQRQRQAKAGCPFLAVEGGAAAWEEFGELVLAAPIDVEELASMGRRKKVSAGRQAMRSIGSFALCCDGKPLRYMYINPCIPGGCTLLWLCPIQICCCDSRTAHGL